MLIKFALVILSLAMAASALIEENREARTALLAIDGLLVERLPHNEDPIENLELAAKSEPSLPAVRALADAKTCNYDTLEALRYVNSARLNLVDGRTRIERALGQAVTRIVINCRVFLDYETRKLESHKIRLPFRSAIYNQKEFARLYMLPTYRQQAVQLLYDDLVHLMRRQEQQQGAPKTRFGWDIAEAFLTEMYDVCSNYSAKTLRIFDAVATLADYHELGDGRGFSVAAELTPPVSDLVYQHARCRVVATVSAGEVLDLIKRYESTLVSEV